MTGMHSLQANKPVVKSARRRLRTKGPDPARTPGGAVTNHGNTRMKHSQQPWCKRAVGGTTKLLSIVCRWSQMATAPKISVRVCVNASDPTRHQWPTIGSATIFITASLSSKTYNIALEPECAPFHGRWSILVRSWSVWLVGMCFRTFGRIFADKFPRSTLTSLVLLLWLDEEWNASITKSQRSRAGIPSMRKHASREMTSAL